MLYWYCMEKFCLFDYSWGWRVKVPCWLLCLLRIVSSPPPSSPLFPIAETGYLQMFGFWGVFPVSVCFNNTGEFSLILITCNLFFSGHQFTFVLVLLFPTGAKKTQVSQANKLKREERLTEIDDLMQNNKELQEQIMQKLDEARSLNATAEVRYFFYSLLLVRCGMYTSLTTGPPSQSLN